MARAWAVSPSARASVEVAGPRRRIAALLAAMTLITFVNSATLIGDEKRAVPPVGMTWLGPAV